MNDQKNMNPMQELSDEELSQVTGGLGSGLPGGNGLPGARSDAPVLNYKLDSEVAGFESEHFQLYFDKLIE